MTRTGGWRVRGAEPVSDEEPSREELEQRIDELEAENDWQNNWNGQLLNIGVRHATDAKSFKQEVTELRAKEEKTKEKRNKGGDKGRNTATKRRLARDKVEAGLWAKAKRETKNKDKEASHVRMKELLDEWVAEDPENRRSRALTSIRGMF